MCELCITGARTICEPIKGWKLVVAREHGLFSKARKGDYGLVNLEVNQDFDIVIPKEVMPIKSHRTWAEFAEREFESLSDIDRARENRFMERIAHFAREIQTKATSLGAIAELALACKEEGWNPETDYFEYWLSARLGKTMEELEK